MTWSTKALLLKARWDGEGSKTELNWAKMGSKRSFIMFSCWHKASIFWKLFSQLFEILSSIVSRWADWRKSLWTRRRWPARQSSWRESCACAGKPAYRKDMFYLCYASLPIFIACVYSCKTVYLTNENKRGNILSQ